MLSPPTTLLLQTPISLGKDNYVFKIKRTPVTKRGVAIIFPLQNQRLWQKLLKEFLLWKGVLC